MMQEAFVMTKTLFTIVMTMLATIFTYLGLDCEAFYLFAVLLLMDYITGVGKAWVLDHSITSNKMKYGMASKLVLLFIPLSLAVVGKITGKDLDGILYVAMNILVLSELYSIIGNVYSMRTKDEMPELDAVKTLGKYIRNKLLLMSGDKNE